MNKPVVSKAPVKPRTFLFISIASVCAFLVTWLVLITYIANSFGLDHYEITTDVDTVKSTGSIYSNKDARNMADGFLNDYLVKGTTTPIRKVIVNNKTTQEVTEYEVEPVMVLKYKVKD